MYRQSRILILSVSILLLIAGCGEQEERLAAEEAEMEKSSGFVSVEGAELHYVIEGKGTPCIVLGHSVGYPRLFSQELREHFNFVFMDLRHDAQSNSSVEISKIILDTYLDDIDKVRRTLDLDKTAVLGHSMHSLIALEYARKYSQYTSNVIMVDMTPCWGDQVLKASEEYWVSHASDERKERLKRNWEKLTEYVLNEMSPNERYIKTYIANTPKIWYDPEYDCSWIFESIEYNVNVFNQLFGVIFNKYDLAKRPGQITTPVFLALGRHSYICPYFLWDNRKDKLPNLSINLFEKSGHFPMFEEQELFDRKLIEWIKSH